MSRKFTKVPSVKSFVHRGTRRCGACRAAAEDLLGEGASEGFGAAGLRACVRCSGWPPSISANLRRPW